jgi:hypothetical protein
VIKFVSLGVDTDGRCLYNLTFDGTEIGSCYTGVRGTIYHARAFDRSFTGSQEAITREIARLLEAMGVWIGPTAN